VLLGRRIAEAHISPSAVDSGHSSVEASVFGAAAVWASSALGVAEEVEAATGWQAMARKVNIV
jgi:hypothetical protein